MLKMKQEVTTRRLVLIKYLYEIGHEQSKQSDTFAGFSILTFHDCVEMLLILIAEKKRKKKQEHFLEYWNVIIDLPYKEAMENLNNIRKILKHHGIFANKDEIDRCRIDAKVFLTDCFKSYFGYEFENLSLSSLISFNSVKEEINRAELLMNEGNNYECLERCKIAFIKLISTYEYNKAELSNSILDAGVRIGGDYRKLVKNNKDGSRWFEQVTKTTNTIRDIIKITALGIDYKRYALFDHITPRVIEGCNSTGTIYIPEQKDSFEAHKSVTSEDCQFCITFVVDCALKLQEFDYDINKYMAKTNNSQ